MVDQGSLCIDGFDYRTILVLVCFFFFLTDEFLRSGDLVLESVPSFARKTRATTTVRVHRLS
jgi:hypothetical protein